MMSLIDKNRVALDLEQRSEVFYHFLHHCDVEETKAIPTAAVSFDKKGQCLKLSINPEFWATQSYTQQLFILGHEMLHVYYKHGNKAKNLIKDRRGDLMKIANIAMDLCVNRTLTTQFGFNRAEIDPENKYCWIDTVFPDEAVSSDKYFEFYYNKIKDNATIVNTLVSGKGKGNQLVDDHEGLGEIEDEEIQKIIEDIARKTHVESAKDFIEKTKNSEDKEVKDKKAGTQAGNNSLKVKAEYKVKHRWESVIRRWTQKAASDAERDNWVKPSRRMTFLNNGDIFLPSDSSYDNKDREKIKINFYLDSSGSTYHLGQRFFSAASSVPLNRFTVDLYSFDTQVYDVKNNEIKGGGGTLFQILEQHIQSKVKNGERYPDAIFCISDGASADKLNPQYPDRWHWFLTENYTSQIHRDCNFYDLKDFE